MDSYRVGQNTLDASKKPKKAIDIMFKDITYSVMV